MRLIKVHRWLIGSGMALCLLVAIRQGTQYVKTGEGSELMRVGFALGIGVVLTLYFRSLPKS